MEAKALVGAVLASSEDRSWMIHGLCNGVSEDIFFPERGQNATVAYSYCNRCDVRPECLEYAVVNYERFGIWGGTSDKERKKIRRRRGMRDERNDVDIDQWLF